MHPSKRTLFQIILAALALSVLTPVGRAQVLTVQIGAAPPAPTPLVNYNDTWQYHKGTNAPGAGWQTNNATDALWTSGVGGFGFTTENYAPETNRCGTILSDMPNGYRTLYIRKSFEITNPADLARQISLIVDWDDGWVAYLNGVEVARANAPGAVNTEPANTALASASHESSNGNPGNTPLPPTTNNLGTASNRLQMGTNVLAILGLNRAIDSTDFILIADLRLTGGQGVAAGGQFFTLVSSNAVSLAGSNTLAGSTRVAVNGVEATFDSLAGTWAKLHPLAPGLNHLFIAALDVNGTLLASTNRDVIYEAATTTVGGVLAANTGWSVGDGIIRVASNVIVPTGVTLSIDAGVVVLLGPNVSLQALAGGTIDLSGLPETPVVLLPEDGNGNWRELSANGASAVLNIRHAELVAGQVRAFTNATVLVEDSLLRDYRVGSRHMVEANRAAQITLRRCHFNRYDQCHLDYTPTLIEDCLIENVFADATDFLGTVGEIVIRRNTYRFGFGSNTDAVDTGQNQAMRVENCLIHNFGDKAVSIADQSHNTVVSNCLLYANGFGISAHTSSNMVFSQNTIAGSIIAGIRVQENTAGNPNTAGHASGVNNIVWNNASNIVLTGVSTLDLAYGDIAGTGVYPGAGNLNADPLFVDAGAGNYRPGAGSPALGSGLGGADMGPVFPVGGLPPAPFNLAARTAGVGPIEVIWQEDAANETSFALERSANGGASWQALATVGANATNYTDGSAALGQEYFYRAKATNGSGASRYSNVAAATRQMVTTTINGGTLAANTVWTPVLGMIVVTAPLIVPTNLTLTIEAGCTIKLTNTGTIRNVAGGTISVNGTEDNLVSVVGVNLGGLSSVGANSSLTIRHADIKGAHIGATNGATLLMEDSYLHEYKNATTTGWAITATDGAAAVNVRRCHFSIYHETLWRNGVIQIEESLFENADNSSSDALDYDAAQPGSYIRRCTFRHGPRVNTDAVDIGPGSSGSSINVLVADCLMYDFPFDKGVTAGEGVFGLVISNSLIYGCAGGIGLKETPGQANNPTTANVIHCTVVENSVGGFTNYVKTPGSCATCQAGHTTNSYNNIVYGNLMDIVLDRGAELFADHTLFGNTNVFAGPVGLGVFMHGAGILSGNPLFVNAAQRDYTLSPGSPAIGAGRDGADLGARYPVGAPMAASHPTFQSIAVSNGVVSLCFWADHERTYTVQATDDLMNGPWVEVEDVSVPPPRPRMRTVTDTATPAHLFYRLVTPQQ